METPLISGVHKMMQLLQTVVDDPERYLNSRTFAMQKLGLIRIPLFDTDCMVHVWDHDLREEGVSDIHTHPWSLKSVVYAGSIVDTTYHAEAFGPFPVNEYRIYPGEEAKVEKLRACNLHTAQINRYRPGNVYFLKTNDIHSTGFESGTVTYVEKTRELLDDHAYVYAPGEWGDARADTEDFVLAEEVIRKGILKLLENHTLDPDILA